MSDKVIQSYVWHDGNCFFVSTINRESSSPLAYGHKYAETMVWEYNYQTSVRGELIGQSEDYANSTREHIKACLQLSETGALKDTW